MEVSSLFIDKARENIINTFKSSGRYAKQNHVRGGLCGVLWEVELFANVGAWKACM
jgi:hypothetical protein